jgi:hypothetical protein
MVATQIEWIPISYPASHAARMTCCLFHDSNFQTPGEKANMYPSTPAAVTQTIDDDDLPAVAFGSITDWSVNVVQSKVQQRQQAHHPDLRAGG